tara:strand:+ start:658 stop:1191 length:534 start_codon:yes stop_codon:yes gene_type:complete
MGLKYNFKIINENLEDLFEKLSKYSKEDLNKKIYKNKWSIAENLYHVWLSEFITAKYIKKKTSYPESLVNVSFVSKFRMKLLELIFLLGIKMKAPKITYDSMPQNIEIKKLRETWLKSRKSFEDLVNVLDESILEKGILRHPIAGKIDIKMTLQFIKMHFHHHRKIIIKLESKIKSN